MSIRNYIPPSFKIDDTSVQKSPRRIAIGTPSLRLSIPKTKPITKPTVECPKTPCTPTNIAHQSFTNDDKLDMGRTIIAGTDANASINQENGIDPIDLDCSPIELNNNSEFYSKFESDFKQQIDDLSADNHLDIQMHDASPLFTQLKTVSSSTPNTPLRANPKPNFNRIISLSPSVLYGLDKHVMPEISDALATNSTADMSSILENLQQKHKLNTTRQNVLNTTSSSIKETSSSSSSSSSQQVLNSSSTSSTKSSTTTSRVAKTSSSQRLHRSSEMNVGNEFRIAALKRDLSDIHNSMSEISSLATLTQPTAISDELNLSPSPSICQLQKRIRSSLENIVDDDEGPVVTFPDETGNGTELELRTPLSVAVTPNELFTCNNHSGDTVKFEEKRMVSASKTKFIKDGFSSEQATSNSSEMKRLQAGDIDYKEAIAAADVKARIEVDGIKAEKNASILQEARSFKSGEIQQNESKNKASATMKIHSDSFSAEQKAVKQAQQRQTVTSTGIFNQHTSSASQTNYMIKTGMSTSTGSSMIKTTQSKATNEHVMIEDAKFNQGFIDLEKLSSTSNQEDVKEAIGKYSRYLDTNVLLLKQPDQMGKVPNLLDSINAVIRKAWAVPTHGHQLGYSLCNTLRLNGGLDLLMQNCANNDKELQFSSARLLEQCLTTENRSHVVELGLEKVVNGACVCTKHSRTDHSRVGTGILENLFKHSEGTCSDVVRMGGLDAVLFECRKNDVETLRHCAMALANLSLYGGAENQEAMINRKVPIWLFPLAFHNDDIIKYYACLAIAVLVANKEIEAEVLKSGTLDLVEPFVTSHNPSEFAKSNPAHAHGQSKHWLERLVPVLSSNREEARNLATFHFCMEAGIKKEQGSTDIFRQIGAIEPLKVVASCPNAVASKFAAQALRLIGEEVPHKLSQQVPLWSVEDVREWVKQIGFGEYENSFADAKVDGDLLLQLSEEHIRDDLGVSNGIRRRRFKRELENLKKMADYSSKDAANIYIFLQSLGMEYTIYTYSMINAGVDKMSLRDLTDNQLGVECGIQNSIHRGRIMNAIGCMETTAQLLTEENMDKTLDVFVSYRRSNGSQLASLLKVHLQLRGFTVFIDVERLEAGKFDNNLLNSIRQAKHFILVLTPAALDRCVGDDECKDWVHREIVAALTSNCNIIPITDNFAWPKPDILPEDMQTVSRFNSVRWIHDYQDACVDKLERFMRGEREAALKGNVTPGTPSAVPSTIRHNPLAYQRMHSNDSDKDKDPGRISD